MHEESDSVLITRAQEDQEAFGLLYERYVKSIYNYVYYRTSDHLDAEDLTARTFHRALTHFPRYVDKGAPFSAWLYRIAHNLVANWHRDNSRRKIVSLNEAVLTADAQDSPASVAEARDAQEKLLETARHLPEDRQRLLILKFAEQKSNAEIAQVMGRTEGAIKSLYHRTLVTLREQMAEEFGSGNRGEG